MATVKIQSSSTTQRNSRRQVFLTTYIAALNEIRNPARKEGEKWIWGRQKLYLPQRGSYFKEREFSVILEVWIDSIHPHPSSQHIHSFCSLEISQTNAIQFNLSHAAGLEWPHWDVEFMVWRNSKYMSKFNTTKTTQETYERTKSFCCYCSSENNSLTQDQKTTSVEKWKTQRVSDCTMFDKGIE